MEKRLTLISCLLVLVMCLTATFAACATTKIDDDTLKSIVFELEQTYGGKTYKESFTVPSEKDATDAKGNPTKVFFTWSVSGSPEIYVSKTTDENGRYTVTLPATIDGTITFTLKANLVNKKGKAYTDADKKEYFASMTMTAQAGSSNQGGSNQGGGNNGGGGSTPTEGNGTQSSPYTVAQALDAINALEQGKYSSTDVYVKGVIVSNPSQGSKGDWIMDIADTSAGSNTLKVYYAAMASSVATTLSKGDTIVVRGALMNFFNSKTNERTPEITANGDTNGTCAIVEVTKGSTGGNNDNQGGNGNDNQGGGTVTGNTAKIDFTASCTDQETPTSKTVGNITFAFADGGNSNKPKYYLNGTALRLYGSNTITISGATITKIVFVFGSNDGTNVLTASVGSFSDGTWTGSASSIVFTVGLNAEGKQGGNRRIVSIEVTFAA